jgi:hypothetical protein
MALALRVVWSETMSAQQRASLTRDGKWGPALWLGDRCVARIYATVEDSRITPEEPEPRWLRDAMVFVNAVNGRQIDVEAHPDEPHEFRTTCLRCGEKGFLNVALITSDQTVVIVDRQSRSRPRRPRPDGGPRGGHAAGR